MRLGYARFCKSNNAIRSPRKVLKPISSVRHLGWAAKLNKPRTGVTQRNSQPVFENNPQIYMNYPM
jgi:hypothetical protein